MLKSVLDPTPLPRPREPGLPDPHLPIPHPDPSPLPIPTPHPSPAPPTPHHVPVPTPGDDLPTHSPLPPTPLHPLPHQLSSSPPSSLSPLSASPSPSLTSPTDTILSRLTEITSLLPPTQFSAAYGSAVFPQPSFPSSPSPSSLPSSPPSSSLSPPQLDLLLCVDSPYDFHSSNLLLHPSHYSFIKHLGPHFLTFINSLPAHVYYNTNCPLASSVVKYGIISTPHLLSDLNNWSTLYLAGRLHKPVRILQPPTKEITAALTSNLNAALTTSLLLAPGPLVGEAVLYTLLTSLSYLGDVRMGVAEDPQKIEKIVRGSWEGFRELYEERIRECEWMEEGVGEGRGGERVWRVKDGEEDRQRMIQSLPGNLRGTLRRNDGMVKGDWGRGMGVREQQMKIRQGLATIVQRSSLQQSMKGLLTAGIRKSIFYGFRKLMKARGK